MRIGSLLLFVVSGLAGLAVATAPALSQDAADLSARQQEFLKEFRSLVELQNNRGITTLLAKDAGRDKIAEGLLDNASFDFVKTGDAKFLDDLNDLVAKVDDFEQGKRFSNRFAQLKAMTPEQRATWSTLRGEAIKVINTFEAAHKKKDPALYRKSVEELKALGAQAAANKDLEIAALLHYDLGICYEELGEHQDVVRIYDSTMDEWIAAGRGKDSLYQHMMTKRAELIEKGFDPLQKGNEPGAAPERKNNTTSYKEGADWQEWPTEYMEMKDPFVPPSTSVWCSEHLLLWRSFNFNKGMHQVGNEVQATPFGKPLNVIRDGSKGVFDIDGDKKESKADSPCKVIDGKPTLNVARSGEGKTAEQYAFFMLTGGAGQTWFQSPVNFSDSGRYRVGCYRQGKILGETILLLDDNATGNFGDAIEQQDGLLRTNPPWIDCDGLLVGKRLMPWSDVVEVGGKWYHFKPADSKGKTMRTRELDIQSGQIVLKWNGPVQPKNLVLAETRDFKGCFYDIAGGKPVNVPVGRYELAYGRIESGKGAQTKQARIFPGEFKAIEVKPGETVTVEMGAPYKFEFRSDDKGRTYVVTGKSLLMRDNSGAIVGRVFDEIVYPEVQLRAKGGGNLIGKAVAMKKISSETFNSDNAAAWFPADAVIEKAEKQQVEVQLSAKKPHSLLGGPFTSDWK